MEPTFAMAGDLMVSTPGLHRTIAKGVEQGTIEGMEKSAKKTQNAVANAMVQAANKARAIGRKEEAKALVAEYNRRTERIVELSKKQQALEKKIAASKARGDKDSARKRMNEGLSNIRRLISAEQDGITAATKARVAADARRVKRFEEGLEAAARSFGDKVEDGLEGAADKFESALNQALSAENLDLGGLVKGLGQGLKDNSGSLMAGGARLGKMGAARGGAMGKMMMGLGKAAGALGAAAGVIAGAAAAVGALVALLMAAYGQTKEFNKAILEGASAVDLLGTEAVGSANALTQELGILRRDAMFTALSFRTTTEEVLGLATAMNQTGFTFKEQEKVFGNYREAMRMGIMVTQAFGVGASEYAEMVNAMTRDFAYGQQSIAEGFGDIFGAAQMSGMGVKNFFTAISEATSGMALYNFRLEDTLELMLNLEKILGDDLSKEVMGQLKGKYRGMGTQERYTALMTSGSAGRGVLERGAKQAEEIFNNLTANLTGEAAAAVAGITGGDLRTMSKDDLADIALRLNEAGAGDLARKLPGLGRAARGGAGAGMAARAEALGELDQSGTLAMDMARAFSVLGDRGIDDLSGVSKMAFEQITGQSGEMLTAYQDIYGRTEAALRAEGEDSDFQSVVAAIQSGELGAIDQKALEEAQAKGVSPLEKLATNQLKETQSILQTLKTGVVMMLELIYEGFFGFLGGGESVRGARQRMEEAQQAAKADPSNKELQDAALMAAKAYESVLQGGTTASVYEDAAAKIDQKTQLQESLAVQGGEAVSLGASRIGGAGLDSLLSPTTLMNPSASLGLAGLMMGFEGLKTAFDFGGDSDLDKTFGEMSPDEKKYLEKQNATLEKTEKSSEEQVKATRENTKAVEEGNAAAERENKARLEAMLGLSPDASDEAIQAAIRRLDKDDPNRTDIMALAARAQVGSRANDFIYRGNSYGKGIITPINGQDLVGTLANGRGPLAGMGGRSVVINNLTINESGNPKKTLDMMNQFANTIMQKA